ncbi:MAG: ATP-binding protein, partial [Coriobacteriales bacterium]|nr:ATP-binding protein [Coriobacteriales bacterium]
DLLFLGVLGWGIDSVALAMCIAYGLSALIGALLLMRRSLNFRFLPPWRLRGQRVRTLLRSIITTGSPNALENVCIVVRTAVINNVAAAVFGAVALGVYIIIDDITMVTLVFAAGTSGAAMAFLGVFTAERDSRNTAKILRLSFVWGLPAILALAIVLELFAPEVAAFFGVAAGVDAAVFSTAIRVFATGLPFFFFNYLMITVYQSQRRMGASNAIVFARELGPLLLLALLCGPLGMMGIWVAFPATEVLTTLAILLYGQAKRHRDRYLAPVFLVDRKTELEGESVSLLVRNSPQEIVSAVESVAQFCERRQLGTRMSMAIQLALEEMLSAICEHGLAGMPKATMNVRVLALGREVIVRIRNGGARFNPIEYAERGERAPTELSLAMTGVMMILKLAETVDYRSTFGVNNLMITIRE